MVLCALLSILIPGQVPSDAQTVLLQAAKAAHGLKSVKYTLQGTLLEKEFRATVWQKDAEVKDSGLAKGTYYVKGEVVEGTDREPFEFSYDGKSLRVRESDGSVRVLTSPEPGEIAQQLPAVGALLPLPIMGDFFLARTKDNAGLTLLPEKKIGKFQCDVIELKQEIAHPAIGTATTSAVWAFEKATHLPIQSETVLGTKKVTDLVVNEAIPDELFAMEGTEVKANPLGVATDALLDLGPLPPAFSGKDGSGKARSLADYKGKVVVLDFWGTWCLPCRKTMPILEKLHQAYSKRGVVVIGVSVADKEADPVAFMKRLGYTYGLLVHGDDIASAYKAVLLPTLYVIDGGGKIVYRSAGVHDDDEKTLTTLIESLVGK